MRFDCGETWKAKLERLEDWHDFFPLWPRTIKTEGGRKQCAWLETIQRKGTFQMMWIDSWWDWEYREKP